MRQNEGVSGGEVLLWTVLGVGTGIVAGFAMSEWVGGVNRTRMGHVARRLRTPAPARLTTAASARAVAVAVKADPKLAALGLQALPVARGVVELRGWVPSRVLRTLACRTALAVEGIESVINSILVRGEDDQSSPGHSQAADQSA
ncbi:MAG TPA: BON domain-containing protein [Gemmatimonadales bacterium]|nr:BON domain-containing protein [Gemmatimonadales bacterium]